VSMAAWHNKRRAEMGEEAFLARMAAFRAKRQITSGGWRLDYVDSQGRTGSQLAAEAGRRGGKARANKLNKGEKE
jgi:hypothetical protein